MRNACEPSFYVGLLAGLLSLDFAAAAKPPKPTPTPTPTPTACSSCDIVYGRDGSANSGRADLMLMKRDGTTKTLLLAGARGVAHRAPRWAPDATWIAFYTDAASGNSLRLIRADGTFLTTLVTRCSEASTPPAWRPIPTANSYWLVFLDARGSDGACLTSSPPGYTSPGRNLWAVNVSLGSPVLAGDPVCLTCGLVEQDGDYWDSPAWSRDGSHFSAFQVKRRTTGSTYAFHVFDVTFDPAASPVLGHDWLFAPPEFEPPGTVPGGWTHWSDSFVMRTNDANGTFGLQRYELDLGSEPEGILSSTPLATGTRFRFFRPRWSPDDAQLVDAIRGTGSTSTDGIYVMTPGPPFSMKLIAPDGSNPLYYPDWKPLVP